MDFNPLDLLASAAELQKKNDGTEQDVTTMVAPQRTNSSVSTKTITAVVQKENKEVRTLNNNRNINNNNNVKSKSVIIRKIKVGANSDLEKMLNEHNYGNAKKNFETSIKVVFEDSGRNRTEAEDVSESVEASSGTKGIHTLGKNGDKITIITVANKDGVSHSSDMECDSSELKTVNEGSSTCKSSVTSNLQENSSASEEVSDSAESDLEHHWALQVHKQLPLENVLTSDKTKSHVEGKSNDQSVIEHSVVKVYDTENKDKGITCEDSCSFEEKNSCTCKDTEVGKVTPNSEEINSESVQDRVLTTVKQSSQIVGAKPNEKEIAFSDTCIDSMGKKSTLTNTSNVFVRDRKPTGLIPKMSTSDLRKTPYVNVSVKDVLENNPDAAQPLIININTRKGKTSKFLEKDGFSQKLLSDKDQDCEKKSNSRLEIIRNLLISEKLVEKSACNDPPEPVSLNMMSTKQMKLDISKFDSLDIGEQPESYDSLKSFDLNDSICGDTSTGSVHLLSPDRRNPDSVGIAESPVTNLHSDIVGGSEVEQKQENFTLFSETKQPEDPAGLDEKCDETIRKTLKMTTEQTEQESNKVLQENKLLLPSTCTDKSDDKSANEFPIFRFDYDHSYAGLPGKINSSEMLREQDGFSQSGETEAGTPLGSIGGDLSQDSGYEDITQSPVSESLPSSSSSDINVTDSVVPPQNLVPVLVSINDNGSLMLHSDHILQKTITGQMFAVQDNGGTKTLDSGVKLISGTNLTPLTATPVLLSPIGKSTVNAISSVQQTPDTVMGLLTPTTPEKSLNLKPVKATQQISPPKFGKFKIGTFASFSNTGMKIDEPPKLLINKNSVSEKTYRSSIGSHGKKNSLTGVNSGKSSPVVDTLGTLVQKVRSSLSPSSQIDTKNMSIDHIQHDHDYCMKNLMPSVVSSVLEAKLQRELTKNKQPLSKSKKLETDQTVKTETKYGKRKRTSSNPGKEDLALESVWYDDNDSNSQSEFIRPKTRAERYIEQKSSEPKVKITGSSNFQDQFVYFMNTKKRSRRRESRDSPIPLPLDKLFIPPKPGDIIVPHLTDQDIENLKQRSKQKPGQSGYNSLRTEFMASKLANVPFSAQAQPESADDEKNIINTILSLENENLSDNDQVGHPYNESMEMYGQGLGGDIMNLIPEQMNLTQEQMDLLFSAVDEVQNSSPGLIGGDKLVSTGTVDSSFGQFPVLESNLQTMSTDKDETDRKVDDSLDERQQVSEAADSAESLATIIPNDDKVNERSEETDDHEPAKSAEDGAVPLVTDPVETLIVNTDLPTCEEVKDSPTVIKTTNVSACESEESEGKVALSNCQQLQLTSKDNPTIDTSVDLTSVATSMTSYCRPNYSATDITEQSVSSVRSMIMPANLPNTSGGLNSDISIQSLDRGPLDLLSNDFRLDKSDIFPDGSVPTSTTSALTSSSLSAPSSQIPSDYSAPWIVTVSMYWNDLPAIMIQNQPYVRLVDIHKQILPAKDTGILKKRCQLMGICVENCSEMQRYFLVQYGKAFNSKSTLIVSKESANELIGYYVDPQPKTSRLEEHTGKSVIEHRREQLRRIALARRAEIRARQNAERKEEDPRAIKEPATATEMEPLPLTDSPKVEVDVPKVLSSGSQSKPLPGQILPQAYSSQRSTRHKKINFLEMLRGDPTPGVADNEHVVEETSQAKKPSQSNHEIGDVNLKKPRKVQHGKNIKIVKYCVQPEVAVDSSETETDYSSTEETDSTSGSEIYVVKKNCKPTKIVQNDAGFKLKSKLKVAPIKRQPVKLPLKVKFGTKRSNKSSGTSVPVSRTVGTLAAPMLQNRRDKLVTPHVESHSTKEFYPQRVCSPSVVNCLGSAQSDENRTLDSILKFDKNASDYEKVKVVPNYSEDLTVTSFGDFGTGSYIKEFTEADLKVPQSLPSEILDTSGMQDETNSDLDESGSRSSDAIGGNLTESKMETLVDESTSIQTENRNHFTVEDSAKSQVTETLDRSQSPVETMKRSEPVSVSGRDVALQIIHRDSSPEGKGRAQLGELFMDKYSNKKSLCIRCYTCRKMMSVDIFLRHLHDVSGGFIPVEGSRVIDIGESDLDQQGLKLWESFQRKKELFDNNQVPSPDMFAEGMFCKVDLDSNSKFPEKNSSLEISVKPAGPLIITTPVSGAKTFHSARRMSATTSSRSGDQIINESVEGIRCSSRKRKKKQLYPCEEYSFSKMPRLQSRCDKDSSE